MELTVIRADDALTHVSVIGRLDIDGVNAIADRFTFETATRRRATLVDLSQVTYIASLGMGMLVSVAKALHRHGAKMVLLAPPELVCQSLRAAGIENVIPIADGQVEALRLLDRGTLAVGDDAARAQSDARQ